MTSWRPMGPRPQVFSVQLFAPSSIQALPALLATLHHCCQGPVGKIVGNLRWNHSNALDFFSDQNPCLILWAYWTCNCWHKWWFHLILTKKKIEEWFEELKSSAALCSWRCLWDETMGVSLDALQNCSSALWIMLPMEYYIITPWLFRNLFLMTDWLPKTDGLMRCVIPKQVTKWDCCDHMLPSKTM